MRLQLSASIKPEGLNHEYPVNRDIFDFLKSDSLPLVHDGIVIYLSTRPLAAAAAHGEVSNGRIIDPRTKPSYTSWFSVS